MCSSLNENNFKNNSYFLEEETTYFNNLKLKFIGEIYNYKELNELLCDSEIFKNNNIFKNNELLIRLIYYFKEIAIEKNSINIERNDNLLIAVGETIKIINGDYVFIVSDENNTIITRDEMGSHLLFYGVSNSSNILFSKDRKSLWKKGIADVRTLKPGHIFCNDKIIPPKVDFFSTEILEYKNKSYNFYKENLNDLLNKAVSMRVDGLSKVGLIFSGGVDSTTIAQTLKNISKARGSEEKLDIKLFTVGTENSKDLKFSKKAADDLDLPLSYEIITEEMIKSSLEDLLTTIEEGNIIKIGVGLTIHFASLIGNNNGFFGKDDKKVLLTGQGADELFGGYNRFLESYKKGESYLKEEFKSDIENMYHVNFERDVSIATANNTILRSPFLDKNFVNLSLNVPVKYKIKSEDDKIRKHILRDLAGDLGIPDSIAQRPKNAAQYGSGIHKILMKKVLKDFDWKQYLLDLKNSYLQ